MDTDRLVEMVRTTPRARFVELMPNLFFAVELTSGSPIGFETVLAPRGAGATSRGPTQVFEFIKAPGNPYPDRVSVGRARNCDVSLRDASVSKLHAHVRRDEGRGWVLTDCGSHNGTRLNGVLLPSNEPRVIVPGDAVVFGAVAGHVLDAAGVFDRLSRG